VAVDRAFAACVRVIDVLDLFAAGLTSEQILKET
jgi:hypothetical protein